MKYRKLRIAWLVVWGLAAVLLIAFWVRGHWRYQRILFQVPAGRYNHALVLRSYFNRLQIQCCRELAVTSQGWPFYHTEDSPVAPWERIDRERKYTLGFSHLRENYGTDTVIPHWFALCVFFAFASAPSLRWHFSLRTLLIATTLVAIVLGLIIYLK